MATTAQQQPRTTRHVKTRLKSASLGAGFRHFCDSGLLLPISLIVVVFAGLAIYNATHYEWVALGLTLAGLGLLGLVAWRLRRDHLIPLANLRNWSQHLRAGDLAIHVPVPRHGQLVGLVRDINGLTDELNQLTEEMDARVRAHTEHIASKSRSLEILYDISTELSSARNLEELLEQFLDTMMVLVDAHAASVRLLTENKQTILVASRGLDNDIIQQEHLVDTQRCLCGHIATHGGIGVQQGTSACNAFVTGKMVKRACAELVVVPLRYRDRILGVYNLFLDRPSAELGKDVRDLLNSIGMHLGLAVEKARLDNNERRLAIMEERNFIGNELHDSLAQSLVSMRLQIKMLGETLHKKDIQSAQRETRRLRQAAEEAHVSLRELLANFRASRMDDRGLIPSIRDLVERFSEETGIIVYLQDEWPMLHFTPIQEVQIFRIIQESLANIRKHSDAHNARILLKTLDNENLLVLIEDDGKGMPHGGTSQGERPGENIGLSIMHERAERIDGVLLFESEQGEGVRVQLAFPIQPISTHLASNINELS